jgi:type IV secretion system protein VirD4
MIMWDNAAVRVIMGGAGNVDDLEDVSRLMGEVTSPTNSPSRDEGRRVPSPEEIRTLRFGSAVVVARAARPVEVTLTPWWKRSDGAQIAAGKAETERMIAEYAKEADRKDLFGAYARTKTAAATAAAIEPGPDQPAAHGTGPMPEVKPHKLDPYELSFRFEV